MKRPLFSPPDAFSLMPFTVVLPVIGSVSKLESLVPSLFARLEKLEELLKDRGGNADSSEIARRTEAEQAMLRTALAWINQTLGVTRRDIMNSAQPPARRNVTDLMKQAYSDDELSNLYELGRFLLENGDYRTSETILRGVTEVASNYLYGWLGLAVVLMMQSQVEEAISAAEQALRCNGQSVEAQLILASLLLSTGDLNTSGTYLGEVGERLQTGEIDNPEVERLYRLQLARFEAR